MPFIAKSAPIAAQVGDTVSIEETPMYGGKEIRNGDQVFLWASETQGGQGLWARGEVIGTETATRKLGITVRIEEMVTTGHFGLEKIIPYRDSTENTPIVGLARKLHRHAHNKIAQLTDSEAELLSRHFV